MKSQEEEDRVSWEQLQTAAAENSLGIPLPKYTEVKVEGYLEDLEEELTGVESTLLTKEKSASVYDDKAKNLLQEMTDYVHGISIFRVTVYL